MKKYFFLPIVLVLIFVAGCQSDQGVANQAYAEGYNEGYDEGYDDSEVGRIHFSFVENGETVFNLHEDGAGGFYYLPIEHNLSLASGDKAFWYVSTLDDPQWPCFNCEEREYDLGQSHLYFWVGEESYIVHVWLVIISEQGDVDVSTRQTITLPALDEVYNPET